MRAVMTDRAMGKGQIMMWRKRLAYRASLPMSLCMEAEKLVHATNTRAGDQAGREGILQGAMQPSAPVLVLETA